MVYTLKKGVIKGKPLLNAILRLVAITIGTLVVCFVAVLFVRWAGEKQTYAPPAHPWYEISAWEFRQPPKEVLCEEKMAIPDEGIAWLKVFYREGQWTLGCDGKVSIEEKIKNSPQKNWLIEVDSVDGEPLDKLIGMLSPLDSKKNFGIYSSSQRVARYLRKKSPQWLYAADAASLVRLHLFSSFWIETMLEFWPDFVLQFPDDKNTRLSTREAQELERRKKRVILLPSRSE